MTTHHWAGSGFATPAVHARRRPDPADLTRARVGVEDDGLVAGLVNALEGTA